MVQVTGVSPPVHLRSFNNDINTLERAVKERVFFVKEKGTFTSPPRPENGHFERTLRGVFNLFGKHLPKTAPLSRQQFVDSFRGRKRGVYQQAADSLLRTNLSVRDAHLKVFVKFEKTDFTRKTDPVPRVISPRSPRYNVEVGRYLRPLEERIFRSISDLFGHRTVIKGMNSSASGKCLFEKWSVFKKPVAIGLDASRFDQHVSLDALKFEHSVYLACFPRLKHKRQLSGLLRMQLLNHCTGYVPDGRVKYTVEGKRMSGDMNTSLGNCILMCLMVRAYAESCGVRLHLANNGDDCVVFMEQRDLGKFNAGLDSWFRAMGFNMAVEPPCYDFEAIEFCQTHPVWVGPDHDDYIMVRHPKWAISKDTMCIKSIDSEKMFLGWLHAVGTGGMAGAGQIPVFQEFYRTYIMSGKFYAKAEDSQSWGVRALAKGMTRVYGPISALTRASFYWAFGVTPDEQLCLEEFYGSVALDSVFRQGPVEYQIPMPL